MSRLLIGGGDHAFATSTYYSVVYVDVAAPIGYGNKGYPFNRVDCVYDDGTKCCAFSTKRYIGGENTIIEDKCRTGHRGITESDNDAGWQLFSSTTDGHPVVKRHTLPGSSLDCASSARCTGRAGSFALLWF